ncbi:helix-turn-helix domain-containing protein [Prevotella sp. E9-3]|uniref:ligand-binding sensor domain-containing protein n=1 Tax=Prevotella sp. E9-3 TaxID=2913621 RepID=UPI001EDC0926|nr:two-component regulator propeller domain-containing protein [Prevotella sp. E9-3]UKK49379.1 helix-turn-helix domain-containing protein [Prevotella sp. E9-3]
MNRLIHLLFFLLVIMSSFKVQARSSMEQERVFMNLNASNGLADNSVQIIKCTRTGRMIISTLGNLNFYDGVTFAHIDIKQDYQLPLKAYTGNYRLYFDNNHHIWLKNTHSVSCVDLFMEHFIPNPEKVVKELGCNDPINDLFVDSNGDVWMLTDLGLFDAKFHKTLHVLQNRILHDLDVRDDNVLLFYDNGDVVCLDRESGKILYQKSPYDEDKAEKYSKSCFVMGDDSVFYVIRNGEKEAVLLSFNSKTQEWATIVEIPYHINNMDILNDELYLATEYGYCSYNLETSQLTKYEQLTMLDGRILQTDCNAICFDKQGGMWIGTEDRGILYARPRLSPFHTYKNDHPQARKYLAMMSHLKQNITEFQGRMANCRFTDSRNWTWYGTTTGVYVYRTPDDPHPMFFDKSKGLLNNVVHSVVEDKDHNIWLSTSFGISCIMINDSEPVFVNSFLDYDNVPSESFRNCKSMCLDNGMIIMESVDHVVAFDPERFTTVNKRETLTLNPKLTKLMVNGNFVKAGEEVGGHIIIDRAITRARDIWLKSDQNTITMTFSGLNYFRPMQTCYRVRVKNIDSNWRVYSYFSNTGHVDSRGQLHLPLVGLKPGTYDVEIQTSLYPDLWNDDKPYTWTVHVDQPWWQATIAYVLLSVVIFVFIGINLYVYSRNTRIRAKLNAGESSIIKRIEAFLERCNIYDNEQLAPLDEELLGRKFEIAPSSEFIDIMVKLMPYLKSHSNKLSMRRLSEISGIDIVQLHNIFMANLYKSPRNLIMLLRLRKAAGLLKTTKMTVEEISVACQFHTPNYFLGNFFHLYKVTPNEYRKSA